MEQYSKKMSVIGDESVGKTSLIRRFVEGSFDDSYIRTIGTNVKKKVLALPRRDVQLTLLIFDLQGQKNDRRIFSHMLRSDGAFLVCDITRGETFDDLPEWADLFWKEIGRKVPVVVLANKADMSGKAVVSTARLSGLAERLGGQFLYTSAKTGQNVEEAFRLLADSMFGG